MSKISLFGGRDRVSAGLGPLEALAGKCIPCFFQFIEVAGVPWLPVNLATLVLASVVSVPSPSVSEFLLSHSYKDTHDCI